MIRILTRFNSRRLFSRILFRDQQQYGQYRRQRGSILLLTSILMAALVGFLGLAIDVGYIFSTRTQFKNAIDAATLAGATGLRVTMEGDTGFPQQAKVVRELATDYAAVNQVRRFADPAKGSREENPNIIKLNPQDITIDKSIDPPRLQITSQADAPLLFASIFGFRGMTLNVTSAASLFPVDGGTGTLGGCWRPLFLPDTFYDMKGMVQTVDSTAIPPRLPKLSADSYRSRFATLTGPRSGTPFVVGNVPDSVTGLRDTELLAESGQQTIMGQIVTFKRDDYRVADFSRLPQLTESANTVDYLARFGYCGQIRVGDEFPVYSPSDNIVYFDQLRTGLDTLMAFNADLIDANLEGSYRYIKSSGFTGPNTHAIIIPVLLFSPFELNSSKLKVTNIGLFFLKEVRTDGTITGFFVREIITGGTPIDPMNVEPDNAPLFKRSWLPMSVRLLR